jgi:hypothetical protein
VHVKSIELTGIEDVYSLTVRNGHAYSVQGGIVVSNSEAIRYMLMSRLRPQLPKSVPAPFDSAEGMLQARKGRVR